MSTELVEAFADSLGGGATAHVMSVDSFEATIEDVIEKPAIGTALPFEGVSLEATDVRTDFSPATLEAAATGVTPAGMGIDGYGTITIQSNPEGAELVSLYTERHVACLAASDIEPGMKAAYERLGNEFADEAVSTVLATGPSATADMGTLIEGVHGPHDVHVVVLEDR